jgi:hypothetical protein
MRDMSAAGYHDSRRVWNITAGRGGQANEVAEPGDLLRLRVVAERHAVIFRSNDQQRRRRDQMKFIADRLLVDHLKGERRGTRPPRIVRALGDAHQDVGQRMDGADGGSHTWTQMPLSTPATARPPASPPQAQAAPETGGTSSGWGGFLGSAATTAAGVAGGAFLFQGLEDLFGHRGGGFSGASAAHDSNRSDNLDDGELSEAAPVDDSDSGLDEDDDFGDDSSWT